MVRFYTKVAFRRPLFFYVQVRLQVLYIFFKGSDAHWSDLTNGLGIVVLKTLRYVDITGLFQLVDLDAEIAGGGVRLFPEKGKFRFFDRDQDTYDGQP